MDEEERTKEKEKVRKEDLAKWGKVIMSKGGGGGGGGVTAW